MSEHAPIIHTWSCAVMDIPARAVPASQRHPERVSVVVAMAIHPLPCGRREVIFQMMEKKEALWFISRLQAMGRWLEEKELCDRISGVDSFGLADMSDTRARDD